MENVIQATSCINGLAPNLSAHRRAIMDMLVGAQVITTAEYDTAMQRTLACQDVATLQKWYRNCIREIARREEGEPTPVQYATPTQTNEIHKLSLHRVITKAERTQAMLRLPRLDHAQAVALLGELWAKITLRTGQGASSAATTHSFSTAA